MTKAGQQTAHPLPPLDQEEPGYHRPRCCMWKIRHGLEAKKAAQTARKANGEDPSQSRSSQAMRRPIAVEKPFQSLASFGNDRRTSQTTPEIRHGIPTTLRHKWMSLLAFHRYLTSSQCHFYSHALVLGKISAQSQ